MSRCLKLGVSTKCWHKYDLFVSQNFWSHFVIKIPTAAHETLNFVTVVFIVPTYRFDEGHRKQLPGFSESVRPAERSGEKIFLRLFLWQINSPVQKGDKIVLRQQGQRQTNEQGGPEERKRKKQTQGQQERDVLWRGEQNETGAMKLLKRKAVFALLTPWGTWF